MRKFFGLVCLLVVLGLTYYINKVNSEDYGHKCVVCIPFYGQSYALGKEATQMTDSDSFRIKHQNLTISLSERYKLHMVRILKEGGSSLSLFSVGKDNRNICSRRNLRDSQKIVQNWCLMMKCL